MKNEFTESTSPSFLWGGGEMGALMRSHDWSQTALGSPAQWSPSLRSALSICLNSRFPIAIYWGPDSILLYNDAWRPILGDKHPWGLGRSGREVWSEIWDNVGPEFSKVLATGEGVFHKDELLSMHRFGYTEECFFEYTFNPIQGESGGIDGVFNIVTETTYRVLNDRRARLLREVASKTGIAKTAEASCALLLEAFRSDPFDMPIALLYLIAPDGMARCCGSLPASDSAVYPAEVDLAADDADGWSIALAARTARPQEMSDLVSCFGALSGSPWAEPPQEAMVLPIVSPGQGKVSGVLVAVASPRRRLDDSYRDFFAQVAGQVALAIANAQAYEEERKRAEALAEIDRAKTVFFSNVSHEFRTPLTLMLGPTEDALSDPNDPLSPNQQTRIETVQRNGIRLLKLVNTLLDFSRIEAGRVQAAYEPTDLAAFTAELASVFRSAIERVGLRLVVDCPPLPEPVYVDREMWEKIVLNLLSNALKFTFAGEIAVRLQWQGKQVELTVRDTGTGIPASELPRLFERFHRVKGAQGRSFEGSGIGLSLVQELVKLHQGAIEVDSREGEGTCFTVSIPTGTAHLPQDRISVARTPAATTLGANPYLEEALRWLPDLGNGEWKIRQRERLLPTSALRSPLPTPSAARILLADDNADMRDYVRRLLSQRYEVEAVSDGAAALAAVRQQVPDLILTDVMMPNLDGFGLLQAIRADSQTREVPVILLSARAGEEAHIEGLAAGADDYLIKPFSARELLVRIEATLKLSRLRREATQQEQALRLEAEAAKQQVETILSSIRDGFYVLDRDWRFTYVNDRYCDMVGMQRAEILGQNIWELFPAAVGTDADVQFHRAIADQTPLQFEYLYAPWNCWHDHRIYPSPNGLTVFLADISDRKQAELAREALLARESHYVNQLQGLTTAALAINSALSVEALLQTITNQAASIVGAHQSVTSLTLEQNWAQAITAVYLSEKYAQWRNYDEPTDGSGIYACVCQLNRSMRMTQAELEAHPHWRGFGSQADQHPPMRGWLAAPLMGRNGQNIGLIQLSDKYEGEFTETDESILVQLAQMASVAVENARLYAAEQQARSTAETAWEKAQTANRVKDEFLAVLSHELRSPLNPILGWTRLLKNGKLNPTRQVEALATIERNAKLQTQLIEDLLDISRIMQGKLTLTPTRVELPAVISAAVDTVRLAAEAKNIEIALNLDTAIGAISGDAARLQQVVWNLLTNAVKFTPHGGQVTVELKPIDRHAQIQVADTGVGISPQFLPHVFEFFRQEDGSTTRRFGGLGLGLAIVRQIVEMHGGTVWAESEGEGKGARFTVRLPLLGSRESSVGKSAADRSAPCPTPPARLSGLQILVVDDDNDTREFQTFVLEQQGAQVISVASGSEALRSLDQLIPDIIVSDVGMPEMDGYMLIQQIRSRPPHQGGSVPAIALTAYAGEINQQQALNAGFQQHLAKPIEPDALVQAIASLVSAPSQTPSG